MMEKSMTRTSRFMDAPKWTGSLSSTMTYKGFDFSFMLLHQTRTMVTQLFPRTIHGYQRPWPSKDEFRLLYPSRNPVLDKATGDITYLETPHMVLTPILTIMKKPVAVTSVKAARGVRYQKRLL